MIEPSTPQGAASDPPLLRLRDVSVRYPGVQALDGVDLEIRAGECVALMGRNGAGKSTTVRLLSGVETPTTGGLELDGAPVVFDAPSVARAHGVATVHQELTIVPGLSVAENIMLGRWPRRRMGGIDRRALRSAAQQALDLLGEHLDLDAAAGAQPIARQQLIEIARGLVGEARLLILDEPTSSLTAHEVDALLALVRRLVASGVAVMYVSHRMNEIAQVADVVTVLRDGHVVRTLPVAEADVAVVTEAMVGEPAGADAATSRRTAPASDLEPALSVVDLADGGAVHDVSFDVAPGEIVGLAGLLSSGRTETLELIAGLRRATGGTIRIGGRAAGRLTPARALARGVALVPEDRKRDGLVLGLSVEENIAMSSFSHLSTAGVVRRGARRRAAERMRTELDIKVDDVAVPVGALSGGNQQKAVIGRCLVAGASVYLFDEPTRGVDVRAKQQIYEVIRTLADAGNAVVFASSEYEELLLLADRIVVLTDGRSRPAPPVPDLTLDRLLAEMMKEHTL